MTEWSARLEAGVGAVDLLPAAESVFLAPWWWRAMAEAGLPVGAEAVSSVVRRDGSPALVLPLMRRADGRLDGLSGPYSCLFRPLAGELDEAGFHAAGRAMAPLLRRVGVVRLDAIAEDDAGTRAMVAGMEAGGLRALWFEHFGQWSEPVGGRDYAGYLRDRPGALREMIRRRMRHAGAFVCTVTDTPEGLDGELAAYEEIYARSWKQPEPFPRFNAVSLRAAAEVGALRLAVLREEGRPVAAQIWFVAHGRAMVAKLAHDEADKKRSPGTILTALMLRRLIDEEGATVIDFGRGDDPYKAGWTKERRRHVGVLLANPWRPAGAVAILRHGVGRLRARWLK